MLRHASTPSSRTLRGIDVQVAPDCPADRVSYAGKLNRASFCWPTFGP